MYDDILVWSDEAKETFAQAKNLGSEKLLFVVKTSAQALAAKALGCGVVYAVSSKKEVQKIKSARMGPALRELIEFPRITLLTGVETFADKDRLHHRSSGLNHITARMIAEKKKTYLFSVSDLLLAPQISIVLGRMMQNKRLLEKYGATYALMSFASTPLAVRSKDERKHFLKTL